MDDCVGESWPAHRPKAMLLRHLEAPGMVRRQRAQQRLDVAWIAEPIVDVQTPAAPLCRRALTDMRDGLPAAAAAAPAAETA